MRLIVTRPLAQAESWVRQLREQGCDAVALPLIRIDALTDTRALHAAWSTLAQQALVMFVSANAVEHFFAARPAGVAWPTAARAGSTGPGTSAALRAAGVPEAAIDEPEPQAGRFDTEALWAQRLAARSWAGTQVLVVRGEDGRDWLADQLRGAGARVGAIAAYARRVPHPDAGQQALLREAQADPRGHLWLFSSSEAVANLGAIAPHADWHHAQALASHPRIALAARRAGFGRVEPCAPDPGAVARQAASLQSPPP